MNAKRGKEVLAYIELTSFNFQDSDYSPDCQFCHAPLNNEQVPSPLLNKNLKLCFLSLYRVFFSLVPPLKVLSTKSCQSISTGPAQKVPRFNLAPSYQDLKDPTSRQNFQDTLEQKRVIVLRPCHMHIAQCRTYSPWNFHPPPPNPLQDLQSLHSLYT